MKPRAAIFFPYLMLSILKKFLVKIVCMVRVKEKLNKWKKDGSFRRIKLVGAITIIKEK